MSTIIRHSKPTIGTDDEEAVAQVVLSGNLAAGPVTAQFERNIASFISMPHAIAVNSGLAALHLSLIVLGVSQYDEVIIPSLVCEALLISIKRCGATPVVVDTNPNGNISADRVSEAITPKTKAIIVPHMFGLAADIERMKEFGVPIIEDCAQSIGAEINNKRVGSFGDVSVFSFYATKMICTGEGGAIACRDADMADKISDLRSYRGHRDFGMRFAYHTTDVASAMGITQLRKISSFIARRKEIARLYRNGLPHTDALYDERSIFYRYIILLQNRDAVRNELAKVGVECGLGVLTPLSKFVPACCPQAEEIGRTSLSLPIYPSMTNDDALFVISSILECI